MKRFNRLAVIFIIVLNLFINGTDATMEDELSFKVNRIGGKDRILTSVNLSKKVFNKSETVILVGFNGEIDALGGTLLAGKLDAPIVMTEKDRLSPAAKSEIERLGSENVIILGGKNSVSEKAADSLKGYNVERIDGSDREETAVNIAKRAIGQTSDEVFLSLGYEAYADALSIGPIAAKLGKPLLLSTQDSLSESTLKAIEDLKVKKVTIVGGEAVVSKKVETRLKSMGLTVDRIYGKNREETSVRIAEKYIKDPASIIVANGYVFPDSVVGGYFAYKANSPIILTRGDKLSDESFKYINNTNRDINIIGLYSAVGKRVESDLNIILKTDKFKSEFFLLPKGDYDRLEASMMIDRIMHINPKTMSNIYSSGVRMKLSDGPITDEPEYASLKGEVPRGWEGLGKTWDDVPGAGGTETPIARIGHSDPGDINGHNSINLELHELAHSVDNFISGFYSGNPISDSKRFTDIWNEEVANVLPDLYYISYKEEYFAEAFAMYYLNDTTNSELKKNAPKTYAFIKSLDSLELESNINTIRRNKDMGLHLEIIKEENLLQAIT